MVASGVLLEQEDVDDGEVLLKDPQLLAGLDPLMAEDTSTGDIEVEDPEDGRGLGLSRLRWFS